MAASDLATVADVKAWLSGSSGIGSSDDALLARLITDVSGAITAYLGRPSLTPRAFVERMDGNGKERIVLRHYPVVQINSLAIDMAAIPPVVLSMSRRDRPLFVVSFTMDLQLPLVKVQRGVRHLGRNGPKGAAHRGA